MRFYGFGFILAFAVFGFVSSTAVVAAEPVDVAFSARLDGSEQRYVIVMPDGAQPTGPVSVLIALHGHGSDRWQFVRHERDECRAARDAAAKRRMLFVAPGLSRDDVLDGAGGGGGPGSDHRGSETPVPDGEARDQRRVDGGDVGPDIRRHPELIDGVVSMNGTANLVGCRVPGSDLGLVRWVEAGQARRVPQALRRVGCRKADDAGRNHDGWP